MKILYLHGFGTNKTLMRFQSRLITRLLPDDEHIFINAPIVSDVDPTEIVKQMVEPPYYYYCRRCDINTDHYIGLDYSLKQLLNFLNKNQIDGIVAFSQATYVTSLLIKEYKLKFFVSSIRFLFFGNKGTYKFWR